MKKGLNDFSTLAISEEEMVNVKGGKAMVASGVCSSPTDKKMTRYRLLKAAEGMYYWYQIN